MKQNNEKQKLDQAIETSCSSFYDLFKENIFLTIPMFLS